MRDLYTHANENRPSGNADGRLMMLGDA